MFVEYISEMPAIDVLLKNGRFSELQHARDAVAEAPAFVPLKPAACQGRLHKTREGGAVLVPRASRGIFLIT